MNSSKPLLAPFLLGAVLILSAACNRSTSQPNPTNSSAATKRYSFKGKVISIDKQAATANIENEPIEGFMDSMNMAYNLKPPDVLVQLQPGDSITADVVVQGDNTYWLENVKVTGHSKAAAGAPTM